MHRLINAFNVIQPITGKKNLMKIQLDNAYVKMAIMIIQIIIYVKIVQHFGMCFFFDCIIFLKHCLFI